MGFFRTLFNVFSGPAFFLNLLDCRFRKAVLHLVLLSLLLSLALTLGHSWIYSSRIRTVCGNLYEQIGSLRFTRAEGVRTLNRPQEKQSYLLTDQLRFDYYPGKTLTAADVQKWNTPAGVLCMDRGLVVWVENYADSGKGRFMVFPLPADMADRSGQGRSFFSVNSRQELYDFLSSRFVLEPGAKLKLTEYEMTADSTAGILLLLLRLTVFFTALFSLSMMVIGAVLFFSAMQFFWNGMSERKLTFKQIVVLLIYTSFPAMAATALYSFFSVPMISPQMVFFLVFFLYYLVVFRRVRLALNPPPEPGPDDDDF